MKYWDASALVALIVGEPTGVDLFQLVADDPQILTWSWTPVEIASAIERRVREGSVGIQARRMMLERLGELALRWDLVDDSAVVARRAMSLLARHPLRAADSGQLGAALLIADQGFPKLEFVCLDRNLALAAEREGLMPVPAYD